MFKRWFGINVLFAFIAFAGSVQAQPVTYYADQLEAGAKPILVSPGYLTLIDFYQEVDKVTSGRPGLLKVDGGGTRIFVSSLANSGATDLIIEIGTRVLLFRVQIAQGETPRRYIVALEKPVAPKPVQQASPPPAPVRAVQPVAPAATVTRPSQPTMTTVDTPPPAVAAQPAQTTVRAIATTAPVKTKPAATTKTSAENSNTTSSSTSSSTSSPTSSSTSARMGTERNPAWLEFALVKARTETGQLTIYFTLKNAGKAGVLVDTSRLVTFQGTQQLDTTIASDKTVRQLQPGETRLVRIIVKLSKPGPVLLRWSMFGPNLQEYSLNRRIDVTGTQNLSGN